MILLDTLLGRESYNPDLHEYVRCETCYGTGLRGESRWCPACAGKGYRLVGKPEVHSLHGSRKTWDKVLNALLDALATMLAWSIFVIPIAAIFLIRLIGHHDASTYPTPIFKSQTLSGGPLIVGLMALAIGLAIFMVWLGTPRDERRRVTTSSVSRRVWWCLYAIPITLLVVVAELSAVRRIGGLAVVDLLLSLPTLVAMHLHIWDRESLSPVFWKSYAFGFVVWDLAFNLWLQPAVDGHAFRPDDLVAVVILLPLYVSLFRYAYRSWRVVESL